MAKPITNSIQDLPPRGGYPSFQIKGGNGPRGPPGWAIWGAVIGATIYGFYKIGLKNEERRYLLKERREARMAILPYLMVEHDRALDAKLRADLAVEREAMANVPGWNVGESVYSKRWVPPVY